MTAVIIDDSYLLRERLKTELETTNVSFAGEASSLIEARNLIAKTHPDIIFLDIRLRDGVSIDFIKTLKEQENNPVVIVLTNYPYPQYKKRCLEAGADYFLEKQNDFQEITGIISKITGAQTKDRT